MLEAVTHTTFNVRLSVKRWIPPPRITFWTNQFRGCLAYVSYLLWDICGYKLCRCLGSLVMFGWSSKAWLNMSNSRMFLVWKNICLANVDNFSKVTGWKWIFLSDLPEGNEDCTGIFLFCMQRDFPPPTGDFFDWVHASSNVNYPLLIFLKVVLQNKYWNVSFVVFFEVFSLYNWRGKLQLRSSAWVMYCYTPKWNCMFMMTVKFTWEVKVKRKV